MNWDAVVAVVSIVSIAAVWCVGIWCRGVMSEAHETYRDKLWDIEQQRDQARVQLDYAIARAEKAERQFALTEARDAELDRLAEERETAAIKRADRAEEQIAGMVAQIETADRRFAAANRRAERAEQDNRRLRALRTRIAEVLAEHDHPGAADV